MKFKRFFAIIICLMMLMTSCSGNAPDATESVAGDTTSGIADEKEAISLAGYKIIRPEKASTDIVKGATELRNLIEAEVNDITIGDDWYKRGETIPEKALEILVGATNRPETASATAELLANDFAIKYFPESGRIVICGGSDEATVRAIDHFLEFCFKNGSVESTLDFFSAGQYAVTECILDGTPIEEYSLVIPSKADADEKYAAELIISCVREKTGIYLETVNKGEASGKQILIGRASDHTLKASEYAIGTKDGSVILCGEGGLVVKAARVLIDKLFPKGEDKVSLTLGEAKAVTFNRISLPTLTDFGTKPIALTDQLNASIAVYDLASGEATLKYEFKPKTTNGFSLSGYGNRVDEARLRYSEKWGTYIIMFTSSAGYVGVASYPEEKCLFEVELKGTSPHSIEYLPCGLVAVASSGGTDTSKGFIRLYSTENKRNNRYAEARLTSAHAVLWDETREVLWAMGSTEIVAYEIDGDLSSPTLTKIAVYGCNNMKGGHDLSAIPGNDDQVWVSGNYVRIFDKTTGSLIDNYAGSSQISAGSVKCICSFPDGTVARTAATNVYASHNTDRFKLFEISGSVANAKDFVFEGRAFYKARAFFAEYN